MIITFHDQQEQELFRAEMEPPSIGDLIVYRRPYRAGDESVEGPVPEIESARVLHCL